MGEGIDHCIDGVVLVKDAFFEFPANVIKLLDTGIAGIGGRQVSSPWVTGCADSLEPIRKRPCRPLAVLLSRRKKQV